MTKHGHGLPRKRPARNPKDEIAEDLPTLEPLADELPTLEPLAEQLPEAAAIEPKGPVQVTLAAAAAADKGFDQVVTVEVAAMDKKAVPDAVKAPLVRLAGKSAGGLRHRRVLVRFTGEAMIGSAVKDVVGEALKPTRPLLLVVRRGFGDETVLQGALPTVKVDSLDAGADTRAEIESGDLEAADLPMALESHLVPWAERATGRRFTFVFRGKVKPDAALRDAIASRLRAAGAVRLAFGERVLFDRDLEARVRCELVGGAVNLRVQPMADAATTIDALAMVLPAHHAAFAGKVVTITFDGEAPAAARDFCLDFARKAGAARVLHARGGEVEVLWPPVLTLEKGKEVTLRVDGQGRSRAALLAGLAAEAVGHAAAAKGQPVVIDWPAGFVLDAEAAAAVVAAHAALGARSLACTIVGDAREPFAPAPVLLQQDGERWLLRLDSEAGKPAELQRAFERCFVPQAATVRGKAVRVRIDGGVALSRSLLRTVLGAVEAAGAMRLELEEQVGGAAQVDVLLPALLTISKSGDRVRIAAIGEGRDAGQQARALQRELAAAALPAGCTVQVAASPLAESMVAAAVAAGAGRVVLDGPAPVLVHPPMFGAAEKKGVQLRLPVTPANEPAMVTRQIERELAVVVAGAGMLGATTVTLAWPGASPDSPQVLVVVRAFADKKAAKVLLDAGDGKPVQLHPAVAPKAAAAPAPLPAAAAAAPASPPAPAPLPPGSSLIALLGRRDEAVPPMILLGVEAGTSEAHLTTLETQLSEHLPRFRGRAVLLVLRQGGQDVPVRKNDAQVDLLRRLVPGAAAATLVFRGPDAQGRPHFQVLHSTLRALPAGSVFADPRARG